ncbi:MAG TPA: DUF1579 family protein [Kofleriaceae bacterium]|nr:DUF1579 family protein [Kofleriaceae bacterium]
MRTSNLLVLATLFIAGTAVADLPKPPPELAEMAKAMAGTWKCTGTGMGMDGKDTKFTGTMSSKTELDGFWSHNSFQGTMGEGKTAAKYRFESYSTFDPSARKWRVMMMDNLGGSMAGTSDGMKDMKMETDAETQDARGKAQFKDHTDMSDMKTGAHLWGEVSRDNGKTWTKVYDMVCKK